MDAETIMRIKPALSGYLHEFDECFGRITARRHLDSYVQGQQARWSATLINVDAAGALPPRTLQEF